MIEIPSDWPYTAHASRRPRGLAWDAERVELLRQMWTDMISVEDIADRLETSRGAIYTQASKLGLSRRNMPRGRRRKAGSESPRAAAGARRARRVPARDETGQRRFTGSANTSGPRIVLPPHHPASREGTTFFPSMVRPAAQQERLLKGGENSRKLGKVMRKGRWAGQPIFGLTLEERETCPSSCLEWATCYGNNMPFAERIADDGTLTRRLWGELAALNARHPGGFIVRLHILGDFYSLEYVHFWRQALADFPGLNIFGFTARRPPQPIGIALVHLVRDEPKRFVIRFSGGGYETHCSEVVDKAQDAIGIVCPAELDEKRCCATCGLCAQTDITISFIRH